MHVAAGERRDQDCPQELGKGDRGEYDIVGTGGDISSPERLSGKESCPITDSDRIKIKRV